MDRGVRRIGLRAGLLLLLVIAGSRAAAGPLSVEEARAQIERLGARFLADREAAVAALSQAEPDVQKAIASDLAKAIETGNWLQIVSAVSVLKRYGAEARVAAPSVAAAARDAMESGRRARASLLLGTLGRIDAAACRAFVPGIAAKVGSADVQEMQWACQTLASMGGGATEAIPALVAEMKGRDAGRCTDAGAALAAMGAAAAPAVPDMIALLQARPAEAGVAATRVLQAAGAAAAPAIPPLVKGLAATDQALAEASSQALKALGKVAVPALVPLLGGTNAASAIAAADVLGGMGRDAAEAVPALRAAMGSPNGAVAFAAAAAAVGIDKDSESAALKVFLDAVQGSNDAVAEAAARRVLAVAPKVSTDVARTEIVKAMAAVLRKGNRVGVQRLAAECLGAIGAAASAALPALDEASLTAELKEAARAAVEKIRPGRPVPKTPRMTPTPPADEVDIL